MKMMILTEKILPEIETQMKLIDADCNGKNLN